MVSVFFRLGNEPIGKRAGRSVWRHAKRAVFQPCENGLLQRGTVNSQFQPEPPQFNRSTWIRCVIDGRTTAAACSKAHWYSRRCSSLTPRNSAGGHATNPLDVTSGPCGFRDSLIVMRLRGTRRSP